MRYDEISVYEMNEAGFINDLRTDFGIDYFVYLDVSFKKNRIGSMFGLL